MRTEQKVANKPIITGLLLEIEHLLLWVLAKILRNEQNYLQKSIFTEVRVSESAN